MQPHLYDKECELFIDICTTYSVAIDESEAIWKVHESNIKAISPEARFLAMAIVFCFRSWEHQTNDTLQRISRGNLCVGIMWLSTRSISKWLDRWIHEGIHLLLLNLLKRKYHFLQLVKKFLNPGTGRSWIC